MLTPYPAAFIFFLRVINKYASIVFTCWTYTLDLVSRHFDREGIEYARIDGDTPMGRRQKVLDEFDGEGSAVRVLLRCVPTIIRAVDIQAKANNLIVSPI